MDTNLDEAQDAVATVKTVKRVVIGTGVVVIALMVGSTLISLASLAGLIVHDSMVYEMGQYGMHVGTGMLFVNAALILALGNWMKRTPTSVAAKGE